MQVQNLLNQQVVCGIARYATLDEIAKEWVVLRTSSLATMWNMVRVAKKRCLIQN
jgi:hypothetical protein